jgi:hypothetical protein
MKRAVKIDLISDWITGYLNMRKTDTLTLFLDDTTLFVIIEV